MPAMVPPMQNKANKMNWICDVCGFTNSIKNEKCKVCNELPDTYHGDYCPCKECDNHPAKDLMDKLKK